MVMVGYGCLINLIVFSVKHFVILKVKGALFTYLLLYSDATQFPYS